MRAILRSASKRKCGLLPPSSYFRSPTRCERYYNEPSTVLKSSFCLTAFEDYVEDADGDHDTIARLDTQVLFGRFHTGLITGSIEAGAILDIVNKLSTAGITIPISFMLDAGELGDLIFVTYKLHIN